MATIHKLVTDNVLHEIVLPRMPQGTARRKMYVFPDLRDWMNDTLPNLEPGRLQAADAPKEQVFFRIHQWVTGKPLRYGKHFYDLAPRANEVWELKTPDVRIFGWMYLPMQFIGVFGDYADLYKGKSRTRSYDDAVRKVTTARAMLALDEPKLTTGTFDGLVHI